MNVEDLDTYLENIDRAVGYEGQIDITSDNGTVTFELVEVTDGNEDFVSVNETGYLNISIGVLIGTFFIDVSCM